MKRSIATILSFLLLFFNSPLANAKERKELSMTTARVLSFLPINSPAMFYTRHPVKGTLYTLSEGFGLAFGITGTILVASSDTSGPFGEIGDALRIAGIGGMILGYGIMWGYPWVKTAIVTPGYVRDYNQEIASKNRLILSPMIDFSSDKERIGMVCSFSF